MKKITKNTAVIVLIFALFASCSKYEDGPWISFVSANNRIQGEYYVEYFSINGIDITQQWTDSCDWKFKFYDDENTRDEECILRIDATIRKCDTICKMHSFTSYELTNNNTELSFFFNTFYLQSPCDYLCGCTNYNGYFCEDTIGFYPLSTGMPHSFKICRLMADEIWLSLDDGSDEYFVKLNEN